mmetsp:Transcript_25700/g.59178  ORF Transcript_25700/g.59178 Transcript_25700/m.59178 type:complete len:191 (+) Transcript_25700:42-614(+)
MVSMKLQKRIASSILKCGKRKVWLDPNELRKIRITSSRANIRKLANRGYILKKNDQSHSKNHIRLKKEAKSKGRHKGPGKREGTLNSRCSQKVSWITKQRVLRHLLKKLRKMNKIDKHLYRELYLKCKGNVFKNKKILIDYIYKAKYQKKMKKLFLEKFSLRKEQKKLNHDKRIKQFNKKMKKIFSKIKK